MIWNALNVPVLLLILLFISKLFGNAIPFRFQLISRWTTVDVHVASAYLTIIPFKLKITFMNLLIFRSLIKWTILILHLQNLFDIIFLRMVFINELLILCHVLCILLRLHITLHELLLPFQASHFNNLFLHYFSIFHFFSMSVSRSVIKIAMWAQ